MIKVLILFPLYNQLTKKMKILLMLTSIFCANIISLGQWFNLGVHEANVQMIEDNVGYQFSNNSGSTPAAGPFRVIYLRSMAGPAPWFPNYTWVAG